MKECFRNCFRNHFQLECKHRCVPPRAAQTRTVRPVLARLVGELWAADPSKCPRGHEEMLVQGHVLIRPPFILLTFSTVL